jgi:eukaryotic-like serine/threonine-protein kinase
VDEFLLPGYEIEELLGFGGSGEVWRAREEATGDLVALKRLRGTSSTDPVAVQRLRREAALLATIRHDHIVALRSVVPTADGLVLVLEYAAGGSLAALLGARSRLSAGEVITIGAPLAQALGDAHARGLVHGDVTPGNVVFDASGKPLLADLGVASLAGERAGPVAGTSGFADPAGVAGAAAGDVHGLAAVCFTALAGVTPYRQGEVVAQPLQSLAPGAPAALVAAITAGLDPDPAARPDATEFARALFAACSPAAVRLVRAAQPVTTPQTHDLGGVGSHVAPVPASNVGEPPPGRHRWSPPRPVVVRRVIAVACAIALLGAAVAAGVGWAWAGDSHRASAAPDSDGVPPDPVGSVSAGPGPAALVSAGPVSADLVSAGASPAPVPTDWTGVLAALDSARDDAFADARADELETVYVPGSSALAADRATLSQLVKTGEHARGLRLQLVSVRAVSLSPGEVTLAVSDTLGGYDVVGTSGSPRAVAGRGLRTWTVVLQAQPSTGPWRIASITAT